MKIMKKKYSIFFLARRMRITIATDPHTNDGGDFRVCEARGCEGIGWLLWTESPVTVPVIDGNIFAG